MLEIRARVVKKSSLYSVRMFFYDVLTILNTIGALSDDSKYCHRLVKNRVQKWPQMADSLIKICPFWNPQKPVLNKGGPKLDPDTQIFDMTSKIIYD